MWASCKVGSLSKMLLMFCSLSIERGEYTLPFKTSLVFNFLLDKLRKKCYIIEQALTNLAIAGVVKCKKENEFQVKKEKHKL